MLPGLGAHRTDKGEEAIHGFRGLAGVGIQNFGEHFQFCSFMGSPRWRARCDASLPYRFLCRSFTLVSDAGEPKLMTTRGVVHLCGPYGTSRVSMLAHSLKSQRPSPEARILVPHLVPVDGGLAPWCDCVDLAERGLPHVRSSGTQQTHAPMLKLKLKLLLSVCARRPRGKRRRRHPPLTTSFEKALITCLSPPNLAAA